MADEQNWGEPIDMRSFGRDLARRRAEYEAKNGPIPVPRNTGARRTKSKQALLDAVNAITEKQGWRW
ncbi:MAG: hypothetical protein JSS55_17155 [Proteobacteria bacterium]|nr:hypothetical protein [Pseudomonadota bacterium]